MIRCGMQEFDFLAWGILPKDQRGARGFHPHRMGDRLDKFKRGKEDGTVDPNTEYQAEEAVEPESPQPSPPQRGRRASTSHLPRQPLLPSTEKVVNALQNGEVEAHVRNFARHLRRPDGDDQYQLEQLLDGLDELGIVDHAIYCRLVQRLAETLLEHCVGYLCADAFSPEVFISRKMHNVLRILWSICLYYPALQRLVRHSEQLFPALNNIVLSTMKEIQKITAQTSSVTYSANEKVINRRGSLDSATKSIKVPTESLGSVLVATLSIIYNCLHGSRCREDMMVCSESGLIRVIVDLLSRTRNVIVAESCVRILDILGEFGGSSVRMTMRDYQVMKITGNYWRTIIQTRSFIGESGFQMAEMIARLGENLRQSSKVYGGTWGNTNQGGTTKRTTVMLRLPYVRMVRWCSSPTCNKNEEIANEKFRLCSRCRLSRYCSEDCQRFHWTHGHKVECYAMYEVAEASMVEGRC